LINYSNTKYAANSPCVWNYEMKPPFIPYNTQIPLLGGETEPACGVMIYAAVTILTLDASGERYVN